MKCGGCHYFQKLKGINKNSLKGICQILDFGTSSGVAACKRFKKIPYKDSKAFKMHNEIESDEIKGDI